MADEGKKEVEPAASTAAPPAGTKDGVDIAAASAGVNSGGAGAVTEENEGEVDDNEESCPKVSTKANKLDGALKASRNSPYAKPQGEGPKQISTNCINFACDLCVV